MKMLKIFLRTYKFDNIIYKYYTSAIAKLK